MMAAQTLEAIHEETVAPATPATPGRVTSDAPKQTKPAAKNPGRVASGKRLAKRNRLAREAKKKAETEAASATQSTETPTSEDTNTEESSSNSLIAILGIGRLVVSALGVYYQREAIMNRFKPAPPAPAQPEPVQPAPTPAPSRIPVKRGIKEME